jgi:hypothetical protein
MGQFYRGAEATFLDDAMFKLPYELMGKIIEKKDKEVNDSIDTLTAYSDKLKADVLEEDSPQLRAKIQEYQQRIDKTIQNIQNDPMNYNLQTGEIKTLSRDITRDWSSTGQIGTMEANKKQFLAEKERIADLVKAGKLDPAIATIEEAKIREKYKGEGGLKWNKEAQKAENALDIQNQYFKVDFDEKFLTHMKPDEWSEEYDSARGMYIYTNKNSGKQLTREDIIQTYLTQLQSDTPTLYAANRYGQLGGEQDLPGYEGVNRINEAVYYETVKGKDGKEQQVLRTNPNNYWGRKAEAAARVFEQRERNTSQSMKDNTYAQKLAEEERNKPEEVIIDVETNLGKKNYSSASSATTWTVNNTTLSTLQTEIGKVAEQNGIKPGTAAYKAIVSGNTKALQDLFVDPKTAEKYINRFNNVNMEINMQKAAIEQFNIDHAKELKALVKDPKKDKAVLDMNPANWSPAQKALYDKKMSEQKVIATNQGVATFDGLNMNNETQKEVKKVVASHILTGTGSFTAAQGLPSVKLGGARVRYLNPDNKMYTTDLSPSRKVAVTHKGKVYYFDRHSSSNQYRIGKEFVTVDPKNVLVTYPHRGEVNMNLYAQNGHINTTKAITDDDGNTIYGYQTMEGGKMVDITVDQDNTAPSRMLDNSKENYIQTSFKVGSFGIDATVKGVTTPRLQDAWDRSYEQRNIETTKLKYGNSFKIEAKAPNGAIYKIENGKYSIITSTSKQEITDPSVKMKMDQVIFYRAPITQ